MYAIVEISGQQFKVEKDQRLFVHRLDKEVGKKMNFDRVLLLDDDKKVTVGNPFVKNAVVSAKVLSHVKGDKVKVFKKKNRKGYQKLNGHRQFFSEILIDKISTTAAKAKVAEKVKEEPKKEAAKASEKKTEE